MKTVFKVLIFIIASVLELNTALAQELTIINDSIFSKVLNEQRGIKIYLPEEYKLGSNEKLNVVYIIDGEMHFDDFLTFYKFAENQKFIPPLILISLPNNYSRKGSTRDRDFVPEITTDNLKAGGANNFITFFKNELIPYINQ